MKKLVFLSLFICLVGCSSKESFIYGTAQEDISLLIANDMAEYISKEYIGIETTVQIIYAKNDFDDLVVEALRSYGFSIADRENADIRLAYKIKIVEDMYYLQFKLNNTYLSKAYSDAIGSSHNWTRLEVE